MAFQINKTTKTPSVFINSDTGIFLMEGLILPEDSLAFFTPILNYIKDYLKSPQVETNVTLRLEYFNTSASRLLYTMLKQLGNSHHVTKTTINWYYEDDDTDLEEVGDEFEEMFSTMTFKKVAYPVDSVPSFEHLK
jgi:hypothetical protein